MIIRHKSYKTDLPDKIWENFPDVKGKSVFIKPNLVMPVSKFDTASTTHPAITKAVIDKALSAGASNVIVGESCFKRQEQHTFESSGYEAMVNKYPDNVRIVSLEAGENFHKYKLVRLPKTQYISLYGVRVSEYLLDSDVVISVPKLKTHSMAIITGSIKNMMGCIRQKGSMHPKGNIETMHKRLRDFYFMIKPWIDFCLVDGVVGSEYNEQQGLPVNSQIVISGTDPWEVDCLCARIIGVDPSKVPYLRLIQRTTKQPYPRMRKDLSSHFELPLMWR